MPIRFSFAIYPSPATAVAAVYSQTTCRRRASLPQFLLLPIPWRIDAVLGTFYGAFIESETTRARARARGLEPPQRSLKEKLGRRGEVSSRLRFLESHFTSAISAKDSEWTNKEWMETNRRGGWIARSERKTRISRSLRRRFPPFYLFLRGDPPRLYVRAIHGEKRNVSRIGRRESEGKRNFTSDRRRRTR